MHIEIIRSEIPWENILESAKQSFGDMVKVVSDIERVVMSHGGELHVDGEALLLEDGSRQQDVWGANILVDVPIGQNIEYSSMVNIRPSQGNRSLEIQDPDTKNRVRRVISTLTGGRV